MADLNPLLSSGEARRRQLVAPVWHTILFVIVVLTISFLGAFQSHRMGPSPSQGPSIFAIYASALIFQAVSFL